MTLKKWPNGATLKCRFLDGGPKQHKRVEEKAHMWEQFANVKFKFVKTRDEDIRISFVADHGSWSALGTDALVRSYFPKHQPTMNFGWLRDDTAHSEYDRVVVHEFGHALGAIHEHQSPAAGLKWNTAEVYRLFSGPPNNWSKEEIDFNILQRYSRTQVNATKFDRSRGAVGGPAELSRAPTSQAGRHQRRGGLRTTVRRGGPRKRHDGRGKRDGAERVGGVQLRVYEPKAGRFPEHPPDRDDEGLDGRPHASPQLGLAAGGKPAQKVYPDPYGVDIWDPASAASVSIALLNSEQFRALTGREPPPSPVSAALYTEHGFPWFALYEEMMGSRDRAARPRGMTYQARSSARRASSWRMPRRSSV